MFCFVYISIKKTTGDEDGIYPCRQLLKFDGLYEYNDYRGFRLMGDKRRVKVI